MYFSCSFVSCDNSSTKTDAKCVSDSTCKLDALMKDPEFRISKACSVFANLYGPYKVKDSFKSSVDSVYSSKNSDAHGEYTLVTVLHYEY